MEYVTLPGGYPGGYLLAFLAALLVAAHWLLGHGPALRVVSSSSAGG